MNCENIISLDAPVSSDEDSEYTLADVISNNDDEIENIPHKLYLEEFKNKIIYNCGLTEKELKVILLRYGINDDINRNLEEIGNMLHITRERVRQLENNALKKMRKNIEFKEVLFEQEKERKLELYK